MRMRSTPLIPAVAVATILLAGCGSEEPSNIAVSGAEPTTTSTTEADDNGSGGDDDETTTTAEADDGDSGGDDADDVPEVPDGQIVLSDVRIGRQGDVERVVFEFLGDEAPAPEARWVEPPVYSAGEGAEVEVDGEAILEVAMFPAMPVIMDGENVVEVYDGGDRLEGAGGVINEAVMFGAFESRLEWAIGLGSEVPYEVTTLTNPTRVVVEFDAAG